MLGCLLFSFFYVFIGHEGWLIEIDKLVSNNKLWLWLLLNVFLVVVHMFFILILNDLLLWFFLFWMWLVMMLSLLYDWLCYWLERLIYTIITDLFLLILINYNLSLLLLYSKHTHFLFINLISHLHMLIIIIQLDLLLLMLLFYNSLSIIKSYLAGIVYYWMSIVGCLALLFIYLFILEHTYEVIFIVDVIEIWFGYFAVCFGFLFLLHHHCLIH